MSEALEDPVAFLRVDNKLALLEESKNFESKKWIWIADEKEGYKAAEVKNSKGSSFVVETNDGKVTFCVDRVPRRSKRMADSGHPL